jgi:uncharacterized membrane protein
MGWWRKFLTLDGVLLMGMALCTMFFGITTVALWWGLRANIEAGHVEILRNRAETIRNRQQMSRLERKVDRLMRTAGVPGTQPAEPRSMPDGE